jgi:hypothetical protein
MNGRIQARLERLQLTAGASHKTANELTPGLGGVRVKRDSENHLIPIVHS